MIDCGLVCDGKLCPTLSPMFAAMNVNGSPVHIAACDPSGGWAGYATGFVPLEDLDGPESRADAVSVFRGALKLPALLQQMSTGP